MAFDEDNLLEIDLKPLGKDADPKKFPEIYLWLVKIGDHIQGPFDLKSLQDYAFRNPTRFEQAFASNLRDNQWLPFFEHSYFQRRSSVRSRSLKNKELEEKQKLQDRFYLLVKGQKIGPFGQADIRSMIASKRLTMTDLVSIDDGHSWIKIYKHSAFDRRSQKRATLPKDVPTTHQVDDYLKNVGHERNSNQNNPNKTSTDVRVETETLAMLTKAGLSKREQLKEDASNSGDDDATVLFDRRALNAERPSQNKFVRPLIVLGGLLLIASAGAGFFYFYDRPFFTAPKLSIEGLKRTPQKRVPTRMRGAIENDERSRDKKIPAKVTFPQTRKSSSSESYNRFTPPPAQIKTHQQEQQKRAALKRRDEEERRAIEREREQAEREARDDYPPAYEERAIQDSGDRRDLRDGPRDRIRETRDQEDLYQQDFREGGVPSEERPAYDDHSDIQGPESEDYPSSEVDPYDAPPEYDARPSDY